jgi:hypothetical protein
MKTLRRQVMSMMRALMQRTGEGRSSRVGMRKTRWLFVLVPILVLGWAVGALADDETDVFNANAGNTKPNPNPGENFVVIQDVSRLRSGTVRRYDSR